MVETERLESLQLGKTDRNKKLQPSVYPQLLKSEHKEGTKNQTCWFTALILGMNRQ